jgi:hypothetical protein
VWIGLIGLNLVLSIAVINFVFARSTEIAFLLSIDFLLGIILLGIFLCIIKVKSLKRVVSQRKLHDFLSLTGGVDVVAKSVNDVLVPSSLLDLSDEALVVHARVPVLPHVEVRFVFSGSMPDAILVANGPRTEHTSRQLDRLGLRRLKDDKDGKQADRHSLK